MRAATVLALSGFCATAAHGRPALPSDVRHFMRQRDLCDHFRSEEPYDAKRRAFLEARTREFCRGSDARLIALKKKYGHRPEVMAKLGEYESAIAPH